MLMITLQNYCNVISCEQSTVAHTRGYKFIFIRSHHMKEVEKTKSNVSAIVWTPSATSRPICRWLKPQTNMPSWKKRKPRWKQKLLACVKLHSQKLSKEAQKLMKMPFQRAITKKEQADMGKLKKSVRGLVVVHPMTALGREMGLQEMTGFSKTAF